MKAKELLATGKVEVYNARTGRTKVITVPDWLFDLATHEDEWIFENVYHLYSKQRMQEMSDAMFTGLLIDLRAKNR